jgi:8-oxo-dGTP pyrophosphatase MutT (NUDIX family)
MSRLRVAAVILYREGKVLLQHRDDDPAIASPGMWACFGGHIDEGEEPEDAALREIEEEVGFRISGKLEPVFHEVTAARELDFFSAPLTATLDELVLTEGQQMRLVGKDELELLPIVASHRRVLDIFFADVQT